MKTNVLLSVGCVMLASASFAQNKKMPNIVIIQGDDLGYGDLSCLGATKIHTPQVDDLARNGMYFNDAHASSSLSSPSRYSMMTGRYSWRTPLRSGVLTWFAQPMIEQGRTTLGTLLQKKGYQTAYVGKWHLGFDWALKDNAPADKVKDVYDSWTQESQNYIDFSKPVKQGPLERGFDYYFGIAASNNMLPFVFIENETVLQSPNVKKEYVYDTDQDNYRAPDWNLETMDKELAKKAVQVIDNHASAKAKKPLFLYFSTSAIHRPCLPSDTKGKSQAGLRGDMVVEFDNVVGTVVAALKANGMMENTLIIITSDNGACPGDAAIAVEKYKNDLGSKYYLDYFDDFEAQYINPKGNAVQKQGWLTYGHEASGDRRGFKSDAWEGGHRIPLIMYWEGVIQPGKVCNNAVCNSDLLATLAELSGTKLKANEGEDSYSYLKNITGKSEEQVRKSLILVAGGSGAWSARVGDWKYIESGNSGWGQTFYAKGPKTKENQLYNIKSDVEEESNLFKESPEKVEEIKKIIEQVEKNGKTEGIVKK